MPSISKQKPSANSFTARKLCQHIIAAWPSIILLVATAVFFPPPAFSAGDAADKVADSSLRATTVRIDNDLFAGSDRGYTNGIEVGFLSQTVEHFQDQRLPAIYRTLNLGLSWLQPKGFAEYNMALTVAHSIFTPDDWRQSEVIEEDRPYAGVLLFGVDYNGRDDQNMHTTSLKLGIVGPSARAKQLQQGVHKLSGSDEFRGWHNQLEDEIVFRIYSQWLRRLEFYGQSPGDRQSDLIFHGGGSVGSLETFANIGAEWRFGTELPDNFGSAPLLPASVNAAPERGYNFSQELKLHGFMIVDLRAVMRDITLDGNTWKSSHSVDRKTYVAHLGVGVAANYGGWRIAFARYLRTREFEGQSANPQLGSLTVRRDF